MVTYNKPKNLEALAINRFDRFPKKKRSDMELGLNKVLQQYWYSSAYGFYV